MDSKELIFLSPDVLWLHPDNIRIYYPEEDVAEMADSIRAHNGVIQALLITPIAERPGHYHVVDGNLRLTGGKRLGEDCPRLKCEVIEGDRVTQLLVMATTSERVYPKDPISKARHFRRLMEQERLIIDEIAARMGLSTSSIYKYLRLLELDEPIQQLIVERKLSTGNAHALDMLKRIPDAETRISLARRFARNKTSGNGIKQAVAHVLRQMNALQNANIRAMKPRSRASKPPGGPLDAELLAQIAANTLCEQCCLTELSQACWTCPGPYEFIQSLLERSIFPQEGPPGDEPGQVERLMPVAQRELARLKGRNGR